LNIKNQEVETQKRENKKRNRENIKMSDTLKEFTSAMETNTIPTTNGSDLSVKVSIEPNHESEIYEIKYDGQEIYKEYKYK
jgi:hypothetical protein